MQYPSPSSPGTARENIEWTRRSVQSAFLQGHSGVWWKHSRQWHMLNGNHSGRMGLVQGWAFRAELVINGVIVVTYYNPYEMAENKWVTGVITLPIGLPPKLVHHFKWKSWWVVDRLKLIIWIYLLGIFGQHVFSKHRRSKSKNWCVSVIRGPLNLELVEQFFKFYYSFEQSIFDKTACSFRNCKCGECKGNWRKKTNGLNFFVAELWSSLARNPSISKLPPQKMIV